MDFTPDEKRDVVLIKGVLIHIKHLAEMGYTGHLTLEIEDLNFKKRLSLEEKVSVISNEVEFLMGVFG